MTLQNFVIMIRPAPNYGTEGSDGKVSEHFEYLKKLKSDGILLMAGRFSEVLIGLVLIQTETREEALQIMKADPAIKSQVFHGELYPWTIAINKYSPE